MYTVKILRKGEWMSWTTVASLSWAERLVKVLLISNPQLQWRIVPSDG